MEEMTDRDLQGEAIKAITVSLFLSLGSLALRKARCHAVSKPKQPYKETHVVSLLVLLVHMREPSSKQTPNPSQAIR